MKRIAFVLLWILGVGAGLGPRAGLSADVVDRIRATINGEIITQSDVRDAIALRGLSTRVTKEPPATDIEDLVLRQLIDQKILLIHAAKRPEPVPVSAAEIKKEMDSIRSLYPDDSAFEKAMQGLGLTRARVERLIRDKLLVLKFVDMTFRPRITVAEAEITQYYNNVFVPQARRSGVVDIPSQEEVAPRLRQILTEQKISRALDTWLKQQREGFSIRVLSE